MFRRLTIAAIIILVPLTPSIVSACGCPGLNTPCNQTWKDGAVIFLGTVIYKSPDRMLALDGVSYDIPPRLEIRFSVTENFRGAAIPGQEMVVYTGTTEAGCGYPFTVGTSYLVYASVYQGELHTGICTPTGPEVSVAAVLPQLRALKKGAGVDDLFGMIGATPRDGHYEDLVETKALVDIRVRVIGSRGPERSTTTNRNGVYSFQSLPSDTYRVEVDLPAGMTTWQRNKGETITIRIVNEELTGCSMDLNARPDGLISGRVVDEAGSGVAGYVTIHPTDPKEAEVAGRRGGLPSYITEDGNFTLWLLPPGRYRLRFHPKVYSNADSGLPASWSDNLDLGFGQHIENFRFKVPAVRSPPQ